MIEYRGYSATVSYHPTSGMFVGVLDGIPDQITFQGASLEDLEEEMSRAVDDYMDFCMEWGRAISPRYTRDLAVHVSAELRELAS